MVVEHMDKNRIETILLYLPEEEAEEARAEDMPMPVEEAKQA